MAKPVIQAALGKALRLRLERSQLTAERVLLEIAYCALRDPIDLCDENGNIVLNLRNIPEHARRTIDSIKQRTYTNRDGDMVTETELKLTSKMAALELAAKHFGLTNPADGNLITKVDWDKLLGDGSDLADDIESAIDDDSAS